MIVTDDAYGDLLEGIGRGMPQVFHASSAGYAGLLAASRGAVTAELPMTATHKVSKPALRRMLWEGEDPVYERTGAGYVLMTADRKGAIEAEYARHGRDHLLPL